MQLRKGDTFELDIDALAFGGQGIGRIDHFVIFVRGAVPGDKVRVRLTRKKKDFAEARIIQLLEASPERIQPPCPYSGFCGGCQWQHLPYERQLFYKKNHVMEALTRIGGLESALVHEPLASDNRFGYRNKMEYTFATEQWFPPGNPDEPKSQTGLALGLHVPGSYYKVLDIKACLLLEETGSRILTTVRNYAKESRIPAYGIKSHAGFWRFLTLRHSRALDQWMVNIVTADRNPDALRPLAAQLSAQFPKLKTVVNNITRREASIAVGEQELVLTGDGLLLDRIGPHTFQISANSFFQTNSLTVAKLYQTVVEYAELQGSQTVLDLYSGTGTIPIFLSRYAEQILGIELVAAAIQDAEKNCAANNIRNCRFILGDIKERLTDLRVKPDVIVIDPPRVGMHPDVVDRVLALRAPKIVYVSCNPATLARDLALMKAQYEIVEIQPVDMFPHTYHIEAVAKLVLRKFF
ncbi:MAG: 23S rRNA (uracil(1939)-C(5))-methyltransferase RlmD [Desulfobacteraceae bacterium]|nr:MAG: 23S rRNA (uracil(1939)-C(5))-methyltransferase RlmD [Desulfobacteraceae bacterium]